MLSCTPNQLVCPLALPLPKNGPSKTTILSNFPFGPPSRSSSCNISYRGDCTWVDFHFLLVFADANESGQNSRGIPSKSRFQTCSSFKNAVRYVISVVAPFGFSKMLLTLEWFARFFKSLIAIMLYNSNRYVDVQCFQNLCFYLSKKHFWAQRLMGIACFRKVHPSKTL